MEVDQLDVAAPSSSRSDSKLSTLQPTAHRDRFLHLQTSARFAGASNPTAQLDSILALLEAYKDSAALPSLLLHDWDIFLALETRLAAATSPLSPDSLRAIFELHKDASAYLTSVTLIKRYLGLLVTYFSQLYRVDDPLSALHTSESASPSSTTDPAVKWTSLDSCPLINVQHSTYEPSSLPPLARDTAGAAAWEAVCGLEATRWRIREAYTRYAYQLLESQDVWKLYLAFEEAVLASNLADREQQLEAIRHVYLARLKVPHIAIDITFQAFSSFVTQYLPPQQYEDEMSAANVLVAESKAIVRQREQHEDALTSLLRSGKLHAPGSRHDLDSFAAICKPYLRWQCGRATRAVRSKDKAAAQTELDLTCALFDRLIPHFGLHPPTTYKHELVYYSDDVSGSERYSRQLKRLSHEEREARTQQEQQLCTERLSLAEDLWLDYISVLTSSPRPDASLTMDVCARAVQCLPTTTSLYCMLMRNSARFRRSRPQIEQFFEKVITPGALDLKASELTDLCLTRIDCERELASFDLAVKAGAGFDVDPSQDMEKFTEIYALLSYSLGKLAELGDDQRDPSLRLEKATVNWVERAVFAMGGPTSEGGAGLNELAESVWQTAVVQQPDNARVYHEAAGYWTRRFDARKARGWFKASVSKLERRQAQESTQEYQALLQDWVQFEHQHGSIEEIEYAEAKARAERKRALEAWYAQYSQYAYSAEAGAESQPSAHTNGDGSTAMQVEVPSNHIEHTSAGKRKADDDSEEAELQIADATMSVRPENAAVTADTSIEQPKKTRTHDADTAQSRDREHCSVLISDLDPATDASAIRHLLRGCGRIIELTGPTVLTSSEGRSSAAALVEFADATGASSALTRHNKLIDSSPVSIHIGWKCTLFVTNFPEDWEDSSVRSAFSPYGLVFTVRWPSKRFSAKRRFCYVQYTTPESAAAAVAALDKTEVAPGRKLNVALSDPSRRKQRSDAQEDGKELFVSGFPRNISEDELKVYFEAYGSVKGVRLLRNADGGLRGIGFVDFETQLEAARAMKELNSTKWRGKTISVTIADSRSHVERKEGAEEKRKKSVRVDGLPIDAQEALIQQAVEREVGLGSVKQVAWKADGTGGRATVEFWNEKDAGKAVLVGGAGGVRYGERVLSVTAVEEGGAAGDAPKTQVATETTGSGQGEAAPAALAFMPRSSRGGRGRGRGRAFGLAHSAHTSGQSQQQEGGAPASQAHPGEDMDVEPASSEQLTGQDRFRAMLQRRS
ncbi:polyadenylate-binding protein [Pseudozyma hubeiensis SY62]|uniref:U4/U6 snRNA-associated-splicing factor PRP24 n=1 Tax=Pseudozyma hubeiensis (strain SY62) TaxID=1305764 RepID=R9PBQ0_PSEHS|nr:polyadenylate-binding protein [Pseudozyma hubeiensis SY62]GAC98774.1 polyadenylate-binding protein [Pseudozyma hubeiensis SY62]